MTTGDLTLTNAQSGEMNADTDYLYINHRQGTVPTGIRLAIAAPLTIGGLILLYLAYYAANRRRRHDD